MTYVITPPCIDVKKLDCRWTTGDADAKNAVRARIDEIQPRASAV
jgi:hypothetical protein